jgi:NADP-dependent 3-hydroxy acid dehydrogenase YdfG
MTETGPVIIVGYGPGVAAGVAEAFAGEGHSIALIARSRDKVAAAASALEARGITATGHVADAGNDEALLAAIAEARAAHGEPQVLVYNAAHWRPGPVLALSTEDLLADFRTCVAGALTAARSVAPGMLAASSGTLLFTGGGLAISPSPEAPSLSIGKASIRSLALMLAAELAPKGVRVGTVTIAGMVSDDGSLNPKRIGEAFLELHRGAPDAATAEVVLRP